MARNRAPRSNESPAYDQMPVPAPAYMPPAPGTLAGSTRRSRRSELPIDDFPDISPVQAVEPGLAVPLGQLLGDLPRRQREVIEELALSGTSVTDTASKLKMSRGAVYVAFNRALATLTARFERDRA